MACATAMKGSSPLTRGKLLLAAHVLQVVGLIPAHAGKTSRQQNRPSSPRAHPRPHGENQLSATAMYTQSGSSPLTRGKQLNAGLDDHRQRLIPAHAGKTSSGAHRASGGRAHPRSRGENEKNKTATVGRGGSFPLTQGKLAGAQRRRGGERLIPAHARKTRRYISRRLRCRAHPRSHGENIYSVIAAVADWGSSPLTRGKQQPPPRAAVRPGLIPTHAGKTPPPTHASTNRPAHPRSRGENHEGTEIVGFMVGSSPLTRGKPDEHRGHAFGAGLIPAHAGKTPTTETRR